MSAATERMAEAKARYNDPGMVECPYCPNKGWRMTEHGISICGRCMGTNRVPGGSHPHFANERAPSTPFKQALLDDAEVVRDIADSLSSHVTDPELRLFHFGGAQDVLVRASRMSDLALADLGAQAVASRATAAGDRNREAFLTGQMSACLHIICERQAHAIDELDLLKAELAAAEQAAEDAKRALDEVVEDDVLNAIAFIQREGTPVTTDRITALVCYALEVEDADERSRCGGYVADALNRLRRDGVLSTRLESRINPELLRAFNMPPDTSLQQLVGHLTEDPPLTKAVKRFLRR